MSGERRDPAAPRGVTYVPRDARLADFIDHTLLKAEATRADIERLCAEARTHRFAAVCVNPIWVTVCRESLEGSGVKVATVIDFPLGADTPEGKGAQAARAVVDGAEELDMVAALGALRAGDWTHVARDIAQVVRAADGRLVKVILETALLDPLSIVRACSVARDAGAGYVKTSTGFHAAGGATPEAVALMRLAVGDAMGVKAAGGIRDCESALRMVAAGATRLGTSNGVALASCRGDGPAPLAELLARAGAPRAAAAAGSNGPAAY